MDLSTIPGHSYLLIGGLILIGAGLVIISLIFNLRVAHSVRQDARHREKLLEYYRNTFSQLGVILIGIGVSLFIFFFQQNYQDSRKRESELQQVLAKMAVHIARGAPVEAIKISRDLESSFVVNELDPVLWSNIVRDEGEVDYATTQLTLTGGCRPGSTSARFGGSIFSSGFGLGNSSGSTSG
jgi:hypothetical protein